MDDFIFDLQRFDDTITSVIAENQILPFVIGGVSKTVGARDSQITVTLTVNDQKETQSAAISLSAGSTFDLLDESNRRWNYSLNKAGDNGGVVITIGSSSAASVGSIDVNDIFIVSQNDTAATYSMTDKGLLVDYDAKTKGYDGFIDNSSLSNITLAGTALDSKTDNFYKVVEVDNDNLTVGDSSFTTLKGQKGIYAMDTDDNGKTSPSFYAQLISNVFNPYRISTVSAGDNTLSTIKVDSEDSESILSEGISFNKNFAGGSSAPVLIAGNTTLHVDNISGNDFKVSGGDAATISGQKITSVSLDGANEISLISGNLTANSDQTIKTSNYSISSYADKKKNNDGIIILQSDSNTTLGDIDVGESFVINYGSSSYATYSMTNAGLIKDDNTLPLLIDKKRLTDSVLPISSILNATAMTDYTPTYIDATNPITISGGTATNPTLIAYGNTALATLTSVANNRYSLGSDNTYGELSLGEWGGVSLPSGTSLVLSNLQFVSNGSSPLRITTASAVFGVTGLNRTATSAIIVSSKNYQTLSANKVSLVSGNLNPKAKQTIILGSSNDVSLYHTEEDLTVTAVTSDVSNVDAGTKIYGFKSGFDSTVMLGRGRFNESIFSSKTVTADAEGNTWLPIPTEKTVVTISNDLGASSSFVTNNKNGLQVIYGKSNGISVGALNKKATIKVGETTYSVSGGKNQVLTTGTGSSLKIWTPKKDGSNYNADKKAYSLDDDSFLEYLQAKNSSYTISSGDVDDKSKYIIDATGLTDSIYGSLSKAESGGYILDRNIEFEGVDEFLTLSSIFINDTSPVNFNGNFSNTTISVGSGTNGKNIYGAFAALKQDTNSNFSVSLKNRLAQVEDAGIITLIGGSILTNDSSQTVLAGDNKNPYTVLSASSDNATTNGVIVAQSASSNDAVIIGDVDYQEHFSINGDEYYRSFLGINKGTSLYNDFVLIGDNTVITDTTKPIAFQISELKAATPKIVIGSHSKLYDADPSKYVFVIGGGSHTVPAIVVDNPNNYTERYGDLGKIEGGYTLFKKADDSLWENLDIISIVSGDTTVDSAFLKNASQSSVTIMTGGGVDFLVNKPITGNFTVNGDAKVASIGGATDLNLLNGSISASNTQTVKFGADSNSTVKLGTTTTLSYDKTTSQGTIAGSYSSATSLGTAFTLNNRVDSKTFDYNISVIGGDGMNFVVDSSGVTVDGLDDTTSINPDSFYYNENYYSLRGAGFVKSDAYLWNLEDVHKLPNNTVSIADINNKENWIAISPVTVDNPNVTVPPSSFDGSPIAYVDLDYLQTYGKLTGSKNNYTLTEPNEDAPINTIFIPSDSAKSLTLDKGFDNVTIEASGYASIASMNLPTSADTYKVTFTDSAMSLSGVEGVSLISGALIADSNLVATVSANETKKSNYVQAGGSAIITLTASDTSSSIALQVGNSFKFNDSTYTLGALGLAYENSSSGRTSILPATAETIQNIQQSTLSTSDIIDTANKWFDMLAVGTSDRIITVSSSIKKGKTLVVDSSSLPAEQYASISVSDDGFFLDTVSSADDLATSDKISIATDKNVTIANAFKNKTIVGDKSKAEFSVTTVKSGATNFVVSDSKNGASISSNATGIIQTSGTITANNASQNITVGSYKVAYSRGDGINIAVDDSTVTIGALNKADSFTVATLTGSSTTYSLSSDARIRKTVNKKDMMWTKTVNSGNAKVDELVDTNNWKGILTANNSSLTVGASNLSSYLANGAAYIVESNNTVSNDDDIIYGTLTTLDGGYSLTTTDSNSDSGLTSIHITNLDKPISLDSSFAAATIKTGDTATINVSPEDTGGFVISTVSGGYYAVTEADELTLSSGTIKSTTINQTIHAGEYAIQATSLGSDSSIFITNNSSKVSIGGLNTDETFSVDGDSYKVTDIGVIKDNYLVDDSGWNTIKSGGVFSVGSAFSRLLLTTDDNHKLDISTLESPAVVVNDLNSPTVRVAELTTITSGYSITSTLGSSITSIYLGDKDFALNTNFNTTVTTAEDGKNTFTINSDQYEAVDSALSIASGNADNKSSLIKGAVALKDTVINSVKTSSDKNITVTSGDITVSADSSSPVTITGLNDGDAFTADNINYTVNGECLLKDNQIWNNDFTSGVVLSGSDDKSLVQDNNWAYYISVSDDSVIAVPPSNNKNVSSWYILSNSLDSIYGTLTGSNDAGYTFAAEDKWDATTLSSIDISGENIAVSFPTSSFKNVNIKTNISDASFKITDYNPSASSVFTVTDNKYNYKLFGTSNYASIAGAKEISQTGGTIALTDSTQTITASTSTTVHSISFVKENDNDGILVNVNGSSASIGALTTTDGVVDKFNIDGRSYQMLSNGSIMRDEKQYWLRDTITNNGYVDIDLLTNDDNWLGSITVNGGILDIDSTTLKQEGISTAFVIENAAPTKIYGKLNEIDGNFTLDGSTATQALSGITLSESTQVSLTDKYLDVPITVAIDTIFAAINATQGFTVDYSKASLGSAASLNTDATGISLIGGGWNLNSLSQTVTAADSVIKLGASGAVQASIISGGVDVTGLDAAGEIISINADTYQLISTADDGISVSLTSDKVATVKEISTDDNFKVNSDIFIKKDAGFVKKNDKNYLWINSADVTGGVAVASLNGSDTVNTWAQVATIDGAISINKNSQTQVFIDDVDNLNSIYGALTKNSSVFYTLDNKKGAVTVSAGLKPSSIIIQDVSAEINPYFTSVNINAAGASFVVDSLTSASEFFTVGATTSNAVLSNVAQVSLISGTLGELTNETTVKADGHTIAAAADSTINVGLSGSLITFSKLDNSDGFTFDSTAYVYKNVGIVRDNKELFVSNLGGSITSDSLTGTSYQKMFASGGGSVLTLQSTVSGVFVDYANNNVSKIYAYQEYDDDFYTFESTDNLPKNSTINAAAMANEATISAPFKAQIITPATGNFTINDKSYTAVNALTIDTTANSSTLNKGKASLAAGATNANIAMTNGDSISVSSGGIQVSAAGVQSSTERNTYTLHELDEYDVFTIGGVSYSMLSDNYLFRTKDGTNEICKTSVTSGALSSTIIDGKNNWSSYFVLEGQTLNLSSSSVKNSTVGTVGMFVSENFSEIYADLKIVDSNNYSLKALDGADTTKISEISLGADSCALTVDFASTVRTSSSNSTYTVNNSSYTATKNSALEIVTDAKNSSISSGVITLNDSSTITTASGHKISGTVSAVDVGEDMIFTPTLGNSFTLDDDTYDMNAIGLSKTTSLGSSYIWTNSKTESFALLSADKSSWSDMMTLDKTTGALNLKNGVTADSVVILDNPPTKRMALLTYANGSYTLASEGGNSIATIQLGDSADSILSLTTDFKSTIKTNEGIYKIENSIYKGSGLTISTDGDESALYDGTVSLVAGTAYNAISDANNSYSVTGGDGITATATQASITSLGNLNKDDTFVTGGKYYKMLGNRTLVQTDSSGNPSKIYTGLVDTNGSLNTANIIEDNFIDFIKLGSDGVLDLTTISASGWSGIVLGADSNGDYTVRIATIDYNAENGIYELDKIAEGITSVKLGDIVKTFSTKLDTTINTTATGLYTINGKPFTAQDNLKIAASNSNEATLINGSVTLGENVEVTTRRTNSGTQTDEKIKTSSGAITVIVDETAGTVTISGLDSGEKFTFTAGGVSTEYTMTPIGLLYESSSGDRLNTTVAVKKPAAILSTDLDWKGDNWLTTLKMPDDTLTLTSSTPSNVIVVDSDSSTKYGTLTKKDGVYTLTQKDSDSDTELKDNSFEKIVLNDVSATFGTMAIDIPITTNAGTDYETSFSVTATGDFTVNALSGTNPTVSNASGIYLSAGTLIAPINIPVNANNEATITATNGDMNISIVAGDGEKKATQISGLDENDTFSVTIGGKTTEYKMVGIGLLDNTNKQLRTEVEDTYTIGEEFTRIIAVEEKNLNLSNETTSADVYDSISEPSQKLGTLTVSKGVSSGVIKTLAKEDGISAAQMQSVDIAAGDNLVVTFKTRINSPIGNVTVNSKTYAGTTALAIDSDGTTSTLYDGTITLDENNNTATDSSETGNVLTWTSGNGFTATAASGTFTELKGLGEKESFTYGGTTYTQSKQGLTNGALINPDLIGTTINLSKLGGTWFNFTAPQDGVLDISALNSNYIIYDKTTAPETKYAQFTITTEDDKTKKTLAGESVAAENISEVVIAAGDDLTVDFVTQVDSPIGSATVNGNTYAGTTELLIDSDGKTSTLYNGTITLNGTNSTATDSTGNSLSRASGSFTATANNGTFTELKGLGEKESFTYNGTTYVQSKQGLRNGALICRDLTGTTINLSKLGGTWDNMLAPANGVLDISNFSGNAYVYNSATNPTKQLAILTTANGVKTLTNSNKAADSIKAVKIAAGDTLAVDFVTQVNLEKVGTVTVNDKKYVGTTELIIDTTKKTSTLYDGTVSLANKDDTVKTTGKTEITYTQDGGDGITVAVDNSGEKEVVTFSGLTTGDTFTIGDNAYKVSAVAPINPAGELWTGGDYANGITLAQINDATNWTPILAAPDAALSVDAETLSDGGEVIVVDNVDDPTAIYGDLTKSGDAYTLTRPTTANANLTSINVDGVAIEIAPNYAGINFTANDSAFSDVTLADVEKSFTLDATNNPSLSDNVSSLTLTAGTVHAAVNQTVTTGDNVITPTAINGGMIIGTETISGIVQGDAFTLNDKAYVMLNTGLFNDTDNKLVTSGIDDGTLTISDIVETQLLAISNGNLNLSNAAAGNSLVVDTVESPANVYGALNKNKNIYKLNKRSNGITSITLPDATSTLTTDIIATVNAPSSSNTYTVNSKVYKANNSALTIASDGTTSTLTDGTINLVNRNDTVTTTSGSTVTYTTTGDGMTLAVTSSGITFSGLTTGDTFTIGDNAYKVSAVAPINPAGELWTGGDYTNGITLAQINDATNWTPILAAPDAALSVDAETLSDGGEVIVIDNVDDPTAIYGDLTKSGDAYTLTRPTTANANLTSIAVDGVAIEIAPNYAGINFTANDSAFSDVTLADVEKSFTLDATNNPSLSDNVNSLTLTAGMVHAAVNQVVTTGNNVITPTAINGGMIIGTETISGIVQGDAFTLNDKAYKMLNTGLFNDTDNKLVTSGIDDGTLTISDIVETQLLAISNGNLNLSNAAAGNSLVVDTVESPANVYGALNKNKNIYKLDKRSDGITSITLPNATSTLTTDIAATVNASSSSNTYTVNSKVYKANNSALTIASDGTTSTLTNGTISLNDNEDTVTTTSGSTITYTTDGDGMTVTAANNSVTLNGLTASDTFTIGDNAYRVSQLGFHNDANYLWTSSTDYKDGVTVAEINNADNWTRTVIADNDSLSVDDKTLNDGVTAIVIDSATAATKSLGTLSRTGDTYTLTRDANNKLSAIAVDNTKLAIDNQLADVPVTADGATFIVTTNAPYTVDATGNTVAISEDATAIEISTGTITATTNQTVTATPDSGATSVIGQNNGTFNIGGETFAVADNVGSITFGMTNGAADSVRNLEENANVTIDGRTYTAPQDNSTLLFNDADGWYFDGYVPTRYNITIDSNGNVIVDAGVKFTDVVASGQTLPEDGTIKLAVDVNTIPINVTNAGTTAININDINNNPLAENLGAVENVTFDSAGVMVENTSDVVGAVFTIDTGQSFETETATITASADDCAVGVGTNGTSLSVDKAATIDAPVDTALTLGNARYTVNGVYFTSGGTAQASLTSDGVKFDLVNSDVITYNRTNFDGTGNATAEIDKDRGISLTSGASVDGATGKSFNIAGTVTLDANTIDAATATDVTAKSSGYAVANDDVTVTGDDDGYKVNISGGQISGLENIGSASGVTIGGLSNGTIKTDKVGAFTVADKTFIAVGDASVTYGIENGTLTSASDVASVITGDFSDGLTVNNGKLQVTGDDVSLDVSRNNNRKVDGFNDKATLTTADNVIKIEPTGAGEFTFGDHVFKVDDATIAFNLRNSSVIGVDSLENGNLIISQDEHNFIVNAESIDLDEINSPVTLEIADSGIHSVYGLHSGMDGLDIATVFGVSSATINSKYFEIVGGTLDAIVIDSVPASLYGLESDMTINSAPSVAIRTTENGTFTFGNDVFNINDTVDGVVIFETDENTHVINIGEFEGEVFGDLKDTALNDKAFSTSSDKVTVISDGTDIISLQGLSSGDSISGSLSNATYVMPEGTLNVNDRGYILQGDNDGVSMTGDGLVVVGLDKDASLTVTKGGAYSVNDQDFNAKDGDTFIAGRDYVYIADPNNKPITEKTKIDDIIENLLGKQGSGTVSLSGDSAASVIASGNLDSPMALTLDSDINNADFSNSNNTKRVTLLGGDQNIKFNDEGGNAAYVDKTAKGKKNIELGNGGDVAVNDGPNAKVSIKAGTGADTIVNRNGAKSTVDVKNNGDTTIVPTSGKVTLQNYSNDNNTKIRTFEYSDLKTAIKSNEVKFGDGVMTLGDAVIVFDPNASAVGGTFTNLVDYSGDNQRVGFTHTDGGVLNASTSSDNLILKGNYAESSSDTTKTGASTLISGRGNDTILAGGDDYIDAGAGENQIYITDKNLAGGEGVTILLAGKGKNTVHNFNGGFDGGDAIKVDDISAVKFIFDENGLVMRSGRARITFDSLDPADDLVSYSDADVAAPYEIQISDGTNEYNAAVAQEGKDIGVHDSNEANLFYGDNTGLNFSEYTGEVEVNLNQGTGSLDGSAAFFYNINKLQAGSGNSSLIGKAGAKNTLIAGTGNTSMWSAAGRDSMVGNASDEKDGSTMFYYLAGDGRDTITNFGFMTSADGYNADIINITTDNAVTDVYLKGDNVVMQLNNSAEDYLTLVDAKGKDFKINNLIAKVDDNNVEFDGIANCYVADSKNSTMSIGADVGNAQIWLDDRATGQHGIYYLGDIKYLDASKATGNDTLVGNDLDNIIYGGAGKNSIWGGFGDSNDTLVGGTGQNTFFFGMQNGKDIATSAKDGDVVDLTTIGLEQIRATTITGGGAKLELTDGSSLEIQGTANVEYRLNDGSRYAADHSSGQWIKK